VTRVRQRQERMPDGRLVEGGEHGSPEETGEQVQAQHCHVNSAVHKAAHLLPNL
jgi:hypothetical protein